MRNDVSSKKKLKTTLTVKLKVNIKKFTEGILTESRGNVQQMVL